MRRNLSRGFSALVLAALALGPALGAAPPFAAPAAPRAPGIVLICLDTLRADAVEDGTMPTLARFATGAVTFRDVCAASPWTPPSVATMFTGLLPSRHGVTRSSGLGRLVPAVRTLAEVLTDAGWHTAASTGGGWISPDRGFEQGFGTFDVSLDLHGPGRARAWLEARPTDRPFFLYLHSLAAHDPYGDKGLVSRGGCPADDEETPLFRALAQALDAPDHAVGPGLYEEFMRVRLGDPCQRLGLELRLGPARMQRLFDATAPWADGGYRRVADGGSAMEAFARTAYRRGLAHVDATLHDLFAALDAAKLPEDTVVLVTGDHGESLGESGALYHGPRVHDAVVRVPLLLRAPGRVPAGVRVEGTCGLVDLFATVLDLAGLPVPADQDGRSLLGLVEGRETGHPVVTEAERTHDPQGRDVRLLSVREGEALWVLRYDATAGQRFDEAYYDRVADPELAHPRGADPWERCAGSFGRAVATARVGVARRFGWPDVPSPCD